jgi:hypothetical protein
LTALKGTALSWLAAQHEELTRLHRPAAAGRTVTIAPLQRPTAAHNSLRTGCNSSTPTRVTGFPDRRCTHARQAVEHLATLRHAAHAWPVDEALRRSRASTLPSKLLSSAISSSFPLAPACGNA